MRKVTVNLSSFLVDNPIFSGDTKVFIYKEESDPVTGWHKIYFTHKNENYSATCDTRYERGYYGVPVKEADNPERKKPRKYIGGGYDHT